MLDSDGVPVAVVTVCEDITERKRFELELGSARDQLDARVKERTTELLETNIRLQHEILERRKVERQLLYEALHDSLTDLPNRALFFDRLSRVIAGSARHPEHLFAVLYLALDQYKVVTESLGHEAGDRLLVQAAHRLRASIRPEDTIGCAGGEEFMVLVEDLKDANDVTRVARRIQESLSGFHASRITNYGLVSSIEGPITMPHYRLALLGFGNVGQALARLLLRKQAELAEKYELTFSVTGIATGRHGAAIDQRGIDLEQALAAMSPGEETLSLQSLSVQPDPADAFDFIRRCAADVLFENTPVNYTTSQPALDHLRLGLELGMHAITANKGPVVHAYRQLSDLAAVKGRKFYFESAVMDVAPIFSLFRETLPVAQLRSFRGILNSTTNLILTLPRLKNLPPRLSQLLSQRWQPGPVGQGLPHPMLF